MVVELPDSVLTVEAPLYDEYTRGALVQVNEAFPGKPLSSVVATHFHYDHIGGIREFAVDHGLTVYAGEPTVPFFESIFTSPHTVDPDRYAAHPSPVTVVGVKDRLSLPTADGGELQMFRITSDHAVEPDAGRTPARGPARQARHAALRRDRRPRPRR
jgi:ribonuclease BN (tRNA processing enzyme)